MPVGTGPGPVIGRCVACSGRTCSWGYLGRPCCLGPDDPGCPCGGVGYPCGGVGYPCGGGSGFRPCPWGAHPGAGPGGPGRYPLPPAARTGGTPPCVTPPCVTPPCVTPPCGTPPGGTAPCGPGRPAGCGEAGAGGQPLAACGARPEPAWNPSATRDPSAAPGRCMAAASRSPSPAPCRSQDLGASEDRLRADPPRISPNSISTTTPKTNPTPARSSPNLTRRGSGCLATSPATIKSTPAISTTAPSVAAAMTIRALPVAILSERTAQRSHHATCPASHMTRNAGEERHAECQRNSTECIAPTGKTDCNPALGPH